MVRRKRGDGDDISLFPFLSILASIIGVLTLLISAMALAQMDNETVARAEEYDKIRKALEACEKDVDDLKLQVDDKGVKAIGEIDKMQKEVAQAQLRLNELTDRITEVQVQASGPKKKVEIPDYDAVIQREGIGQMQEQQEQLREQIAQLEKELEDRGKPPVESEVSILPGGSGLGFQPVFIECAAGSIVLHTTKEPQRVRQADLASEKAFIELLDQVAASEKKSVIFLVRSDGLSTYRTSRDLANAHDARNGKLPVIGQGRLNLGYFTDK